jgi:hypothetical protein
MNTKNTLIKINVTNKYNKPIKNAKIKLIKIDDNFYDKQLIFENHTNEEGFSEFNIFPDDYLLQISKRNFYSEQIVHIEKKEIIELQLPIIFGWLKKENKIHEDELKKTYEQNRTDHKLCFYCKKKYDNYLDKFSCKYCHKYYCTEHRIPEYHKCSGNPKSVSKTHREIYSSGNTTILSK